MWWLRRKMEYFVLQRNINFCSYIVLQLFFEAKKKKNGCSSARARLWTVLVSVFAAVKVFWKRTIVACFRSLCIGRVRLFSIHPPLCNDTFSSGFISMKTLSRFFALPLHAWPYLIVSLEIITHQNAHYSPSILLCRLALARLAITLKWYALTTFS